MAAPLRRSREYDPFAWLYTRYWGGAFHQAAMPMLDQTILGDLKSGAAVLDLCCGDGRLSAELERRRFRVVGLDSSEQMLAYARQRCPRIKFLLADAREFDLPPRFDAAISTFDSLNHILTTPDLRKVMNNVWRCLKRDAAFVFDLNGESTYRELWARTSTMVEEEVVSIARGAYDTRKHLARCDVTVFRLDGGAWVRSDFWLRQKHHSPERVLRELSAAGFQASVYDASRVGMQGHYAFGRDVYVARKRDAKIPRLDL